MLRWDYVWVFVELYVKLLVDKVPMVIREATHHKYRESSGPLVCIHCIYLTSLVVIAFSTRITHLERVSRD